MKQLTFLSIFTLLQWSAIGQSVHLPAFDAISTSGSVKVELIKSNTTRADFEIIKGDKEDLVIEVKNKELIVKIKSSFSLWNRSNTKAKVTVYYQSINEIDCSAGSSLFTDSEITATAMDIDVSSGANCSIKLKSDEVMVSSSSGSKVTINGITSTANYDASSGSSIDATYLIASTADADVSSGASISLYATDKLKAEASSGGSIRYKGKPESTNLSSGMSGSITSF
ncbi:MAG: head GIN domain-containing protein [Saprospiraceae bacterium]